MRLNLLIHLAVGLVIGFFSIAALTAPSESSPVKSPQDMLLDPEGHIHIDEDGVARSYAANGTIIDTTTLTPAHLTSILTSHSDSASSSSSNKPHSPAGLTLKARAQLSNQPSKSALETTPSLFKKQDLNPVCQGEFCVNNADCFKLGCPGDSCFYAERWFVKTCHDLMNFDSPGL